MVWSIYTHEVLPIRSCYIWPVWQRKQSELYYNANLNNRKIINTIIEERYVIRKTMIIICKTSEFQVNSFPWEESSPQESSPQLAKNAIKMFCLWPYYSLKQLSFAVDATTLQNPHCWLDFITLNSWWLYTFHKLLSLPWNWTDEKAVQVS